MEITFAGKRALITGAASGIGRGIAVQLLKCGAHVIGLDVSKPGLENLKKEQPDIQIVNVDVRNWTATKEAVKSVCPVDLLVNNVGIGNTAPLPDVTKEMTDEIFDVNVKAPINVTQTVIQDMMCRKSSGSIVNISSQASKAGLPNHELYCATKSAIDGFMRAIVLDYGANNIRMNCVNPTVVLTKLGKEFWSDPALAEPMLAKIPLKRFAEVDEVVYAVLFLLSDKSSMINGVCLPVDGGFLAC